MQQDKPLFEVDEEHNVWIRCTRSAFIKGVEFEAGEKLHFHWNTLIDLFQCEHTNRYRPDENLRADIKLTIDELCNLVKSYSFEVHHNDWALDYYSYSS